MPKSAHENRPPAQREAFGWPSEDVWDLSFVQSVVWSTPGKGDGHVLAVAVGTGTRWSSRKNSHFCFSVQPRLHAGRCRESCVKRDACTAVKRACPRHVGCAEHLLSGEHHWHGEIVSSQSMISVETSDDACMPMSPVIQATTPPPIMTNKSHPYTLLYE